MKSKSIMMAAAVFGLLSVALGAFAAHGLKLEPHDAQIWETAVRYQIYHALALLLLGGFGMKNPSFHFRGVAQFFTVGIVIFSGSLYLLALSGARWWGAVTPVGGICFLIGWILFMIRIREIRE